MQKGDKTFRDRKLIGCALKQILPSAFSQAQCYLADAIFTMSTIIVWNAKIVFLAVNHSINFEHNIVH